MPYNKRPRMGCSSHSSIIKEQTSLLKPNSLAQPGGDNNTSLAKVHEFAITWAHQFCCGYPQQNNDTRKVAIWKIRQNRLNRQNLKELPTASPSFYAPTWAFSSLELTLGTTVLLFLCGAPHWGRCLKELQRARSHCRRSLAVVDEASECAEPFA